MLSSSVLLLAFASIATAFNSTSANYPYTIPAGSQPLSITQPWCTAQKNSCGSICGGQAYPNDCDASTLTYNCVCSQISTPNITQYSQTLPFFTCSQYMKNCVASTDSAAAQQACLKIPCGSMDSTKAATGSSSASSAASTTSMSAASSASSAAGGVASSASGGASSAAGTVTSAAGSATSAAGGVVGSATSAVASATSAVPGNNAAAATAGFGMLGAAVAGLIAFVA